MYVSNLLSYHTGSAVTFENAINSWKEGRSIFKKFYRIPVLCNMKQILIPPRAYIVNLYEFSGTIKLKNVKIVRDPATFPAERDKNVSKFEINVDTVDVVISFLWWLQGTIIALLFNHDSISNLN